MSVYYERELTDAADLCLKNGELNRECVGWARKPIVNCNLKGRWPRKKKWNYWCVMDGECLFSATVSNIDYAGMVFVYFLDYKTKKFVEKTIMTPLGSGCAMPAGVREDVFYKDAGMDIQLLREGGGTHLHVRSGDFGGETLSADIQVDYPDGYETLNVVIPWNSRTFQFTSKHEGLPARGTVKVGERVYQLNEEACGCLDFGRGIWPYKVIWNWASAGGMSEGRRIGLNLGGGWTDNTGMNENAIVVDGKLSKISEDMVFDYDKGDRMKPWRIRGSESDCVELVMTPFYERVARSNLGIIVSEVHQMIGRFSGRLKMQNGDTIGIDNLLGIVEDHFGKW